MATTKKITKKPVAKKVATKKVTARKPAAKKPAVIKAPAKKVAARKTAAKTVVKKVAAKKIVAKKTIVKKPVVKKVAAKTKTKAPAKPKGAYGLPEQLRDALLKVLDERQAEQIVTVDLHGRSAMADYAIIATGKSARQLAAIADYASSAAESLGIKQVKIEGLPQGDWVLVDLGDVVMHLFRPEVRQYYAIEEIWSTKPTR